MFLPGAIAIVNSANCPLLIKTSLDDIDREAAIKLIYLLHASLDIVEEKSEQPTSRDNFLGVLYQCEQYKIYGLMSTTKIKILLMLSNKMNYGLLPRENDIKQMLKNIHKVYVDATAMNPFYKPNEPIRSKRLDSYLETIFNPTVSTATTTTTTNVSMHTVNAPLGQASDFPKTSAPSSIGTPAMQTI